MTEFDAIIKNINRFIQLDEGEKEIFISLLRVTRAKKKQQIVQPDFVCKYRTYVLSGALKAYYVDDDAQEHTIALAIIGGRHFLYRKSAQSGYLRNILYISEGADRRNHQKPVSSQEIPV